MSEVNEWEEEFREFLEEIAWSHLARLGIPVEVTPDETVNVDPEALVVFVARIGRNNSRLFRETLDWSRAFDDVLSKMRFKRVIQRAGPSGETRAVLGGFFQTLDESDSTRQSWTSLVQHLGINHDPVEEVVIGESESVSSGNQSETFAEWGVQSPDFFRTRDRTAFSEEARETWIQSNDRLRLRKLIDNAPRAEVVNFLAHGGVGNSNSVAGELNLSQPQVHTVLRDLREAGLVRSWEDGRSRTFAFAGDPGEYGFVDDEEVFANWELFFKALGDVLTEVRTRRETDLSAYQQSKLQDRLHEEFVGTLRASDYHEFPETTLYDRIFEALNAIDPESIDEVRDRFPPTG